MLDAGVLMHSCGGCPVGRVWVLTTYYNIYCGRGYRGEVGVEVSYSGGGANSGCSYACDVEWCILLLGGPLGLSVILFPFLEIVVVLFL